MYHVDEDGCRVYGEITFKRALNEEELQSIREDVEDITGYIMDDLRIKDGDKKNSIEIRGIDAMYASGSFEKQSRNAWRRILIRLHQYPIKSGFIDLEVGRLSFRRGRWYEDYYRPKLIKSKTPFFRAKQKMIEVTISTPVDSRTPKAVNVESTVQSVIDEYAASTGINVNGMRWRIIALDGHGDDDILELNRYEHRWAFVDLGFDNSRVCLMGVPGGGI